MSWEIKIWHEVTDDHVRLSIEATPEVPDEVVSHLTGIYWADEVQGYGDAWEDSNSIDLQPSSRIQG